MWPWEHLAVAYLGYSLMARAWGRTVTGRLVVAVGVGSQFPDLVDKPLWWAGVTPAGRVPIHSVLIGLPLSLVVLRMGSRYDYKRTSVAFVIGYLLHIPADVVLPLIAGSTHELSFLLWPALPVTPGAGDAVIRMFDISTSPLVFFSANPYRALLVFSSIIVWSVDGFPGLSDLGEFLRSSRQRHQK